MFSARCPSLFLSVCLSHNIFFGLSWVFFFYNFHIFRLEEMHSVIIKDTGIPDEHLYGRAGYLAAVMFVQSHLGDDVIHTDMIHKVCVYEFAIASPQQ